MTTATTTATEPKASFTPAQIAERFRMWETLATNGDLAAAKAVYRTLLDRDDDGSARRIVRVPRDAANQMLIPFALWRAASQWKGGMLLLRYSANIFPHRDEVDERVEVNVIYIERLAKPHLLVPHGYHRSAGKVPHQYRVLLTEYAGTRQYFTDAEFAKLGYGLTRALALDAALADYRGEVESAKQVLAERELSLAVAEKLAGEWLETHEG